MLDRSKGMCQIGRMETVQYADVARDLAVAREKGDQLLTRIRNAAAYLKETHGYALALFAQITGLHKNSVMKLKDLTWVPNAETLEKLEKLVEREAAKRGGRLFPGENVKRGRPPAAPIRAKQEAGKRAPGAPRKAAASGRRKVN